MTTRNRRRPLSAAEMDIVLSYVKTRADLARRRGTTRAIVDELIVLLLAKAGLRPNELCRLRIGDLLGTNGERMLGIRDTRGDTARQVDIGEDLADRLARFIKCHRNRAQAKDSLLESERGRLLSYMSLYSKVRRIGRETGIGRLSPAALRQTYIHQLYEAEQDLRYVQQQTGYTRARSVAEQLKIRSPQDTWKTGSATRAEQGAMEPKPVCESCGAAVPGDGGRRIESGQLLCNECLKYFHKT